MIRFQQFKIKDLTPYRHIEALAGEGCIAVNKLLYAPGTNVETGTDLSPNKSVPVNLIPKLVNYHHNYREEDSLSR